MSECSDVLYLTAIACQIAKGMTVDELSIFAADLVVLGDMLAAIATRRGICCDRLKEFEDNNQQESEHSCEDENYCDCTYKK